MMEQWKVCGGDVSNRKLVLLEKTESFRQTEIDVYEPEVWSIDSSYDETTEESTPGPKDRALTEACKRFMKEVTPKKATYLSRVRSMYNLIETFKDLNGGVGDTFVRDAFIPWIQQAGLCMGIDADRIWDEIMK